MLKDQLSDDTFGLDQNPCLHVKVILPGYRLNCLAGEKQKNPQPWTDRGSLAVSFDVAADNQRLEQDKKKLLTAIICLRQSVSQTLRAYPIARGK
jgi:hypothetical protein